MESRTPRIAEFGPFQLDLEEGTLRRDGEPVALTPKGTETLRVLVSSEGHIVTKAELLERVWPDTFVDENNLAQNISALRRVLGENPEGRPYIETVPRRGYRFSSGTRVRDPQEATHPATPSASGGTVASTPEPPAIARPPRALHRVPEIHYTRSGEVNIAYQVIGDAPLDLVFVMGWVSHLEYFWNEPSFARFLTRLASFSRLILFDKRGTGLSDRVPVNELPTLEQRMDDVRAVMDAVGSKRAALIGVSEGGPMCSLFAATYPEKTSAIIMIGTYAKRIWAPDYPWAPTVEQRAKFIESLQDHWGGPVGIEDRAPSRADDPAFRAWWATYLRMGASPGAAVALTRMNAEIDVRQVLPSIRVPSLVIHRSGDMCLRIDEGRFVASMIPGARFVELPGADHLPFVGDQDAILDEIEEFLTGVRHTHEPDRVLATVLFTTIDRAAADAHDLERLEAQVAREVEWFRGRRVGGLGDGLLATFDGPARAIRAAFAIRKYGSHLGVPVSAGLHTGECDFADESVGGIAVEIGGRIAAAAAPGEILVSSTVKDLVAGAGIAFGDRGRVQLSGAPGEWHLYTV